MHITSYQKYIDQWMHLERYVNSGSDHKFSQQSDVDPEFRPSSQIKSFPLYQLQDNIFAKDEEFLPANLYPVHPFTAKKYITLGEKVIPTEYLAIPTSSTRTMLVSKDNFKSSFFLKLDLPARVSRFYRTINKSDVEFSRQLDHFLPTIHIGSNHAYGIFREIGGGYTQLKSAREAGYIARELYPTWVSNNLPNDYLLIPAFAMISTDRQDSDQAPLLIQILKRSQDPKEVMFDNILIPLLKLWFSLAERGILWEMQQQNTLFVIDAAHKVIGIAIRDYDGVYLDPTIVKGDFIKHTLLTPQQREMRYSITFDHRVCKQNLLRLIDCYSQFISESQAMELKLMLAAYIEENLPANVYAALPAHRWFTVPEVEKFVDTLDTVLLTHPPLRLG